MLEAYISAQVALATQDGAVSKTVETVEQSTETTITESDNGQENQE